MQVDLPLAVPRLGVVHLSPPSLLADVDARAVRRNVWDLDTESFSEAQPRRCAEYEEHAVLVPQFAFHVHVAFGVPVRVLPRGHDAAEDRKSTRLNSSHTVISYAVFCLKKKK